MKCTFLERDYVQRLDNTICRYEGEPYLIRVDGTRVRLYDIANTDRVIDTIDPKHDAFDISSIPLGYMQNNALQVAYVMRRPSRVYKQGVNGDNLSFRNINLKQNVSIGSMYTQQFKAMAKETYPPLKAILKDLLATSEPMEKAVSRNVALRVNPKLKLIYVYYKGEQVGIIPEGTNTVFIPSGDMAWIVSKELSIFDWVVQ